MTSRSKILAFGASNSSTSINHKLAEWAANKVENVDVNLIRIGAFNLPIFGVDLEKEVGQHTEAQRFIDVIAQSDGIVVSLAEHNGSYTTAFKNLLDWASRIESKIWQNKPILVLSTSPGKRGGASVSASFRGHMPFMGANIISHFILPSFNRHFKEDIGIADSEYKTQFEKALRLFEQSLA